MSNEIFQNAASKGRQNTQKVAVSTYGGKPLEQQLAFGAQIPKQNRGNTFFHNQRGELGIAQPSAKKTEPGEVSQFMFEEKSEYIHSSVASSFVEDEDFAQH